MVTLTQCKNLSILTPSNRRHRWVKILSFKRHLHRVFCWYWCFDLWKAKHYWWTPLIMTEITSNTMVTLTLSGAWWPWICQRKACLKKKTLNDLEDNNFNNFNNHHLRRPPVRTSSNNDIFKRTPSGHVNVALMTFQEHQSGDLQNKNVDVELLRIFQQWDLKKWRQASNSTKVETFGVEGGQEQKLGAIIQSYWS